MNIYQSAFLGLIQGLTEFLPVSSSGHLVLAQHFLPGFSQPGVLFDVLLHMGTLLSVVIYFWKKLLKMDINYVKLLVVGTIPAGLAGILFSDFFESMFASIIFTGIGFLISALINFYIDKKNPQGKEISLRDSLIIGIFQAISIIPSISRSGATIAAASGLGIEKEKAAEFSFIMSIPAILGANLVQILKYSGSLNQNLEVYFVGVLVAFVTGIVAIKLTLATLTQRKFIYFAAYCTVLGIICFTL